MAISFMCLTNKIGPALDLLHDSNCRVLNHIPENFVDLQSYHIQNPIKVESIDKNSLLAHVLNRCPKKDKTGSFQVTLVVERRFPIYEKILRIIFGICIFPVTLILPSNCLPIGWGSDKGRFFRSIEQIAIIVFNPNFNQNVQQIWEDGHWENRAQLLVEQQLHAPLTLLKKLEELGDEGLAQHAIGNDFLALYYVSTGNLPCQVDPEAFPKQNKYTNDIVQIRETRNHPENDNDSIYSSVRDDDDDDELLPLERNTQTQYHAGMDFRE